MLLAGATLMGAPADGIVVPAASVVAQPARRRPPTPRAARSRLTAPPQVATALTQAAGARRTRGLPTRRPRRLEVIPPQFNPPYPWAETTQPRRIRGLLTPRRPRLAQPVPPQVNPPYPWAELLAPRRIRGLLPRRGHTATPVAAQGGPVDEAEQPRRWRGWPTRPRRPIETVPPQFNPPYPWADITQPRRTRGLLPRRGRQALPVPVQDPPITEATQPRRLRGLLPRRGKPVTPVPPQFNPPYPFAEVAQPRRVRGVFERRGHPVQPVPMQDPAGAGLLQPRRVRSILPRRGHQAQPVPPQVNPPYPWVELVAPRRIRSLFTRRGHATAPTPTTDTVQGAVRRRPTLVTPRRGHTITPVPPQVVTPPAWVPGAIRARVRVAWQRRGHTVTPPTAQPGLVSVTRTPRPRLAAPARRGHSATPTPPPAPPVWVAAFLRAAWRRLLPIRRGHHNTPVGRQLRDVIITALPPDTRWSATVIPTRWASAPPNTRWVSTSLPVRWATVPSDVRWVVTLLAPAALSTASLQYVRARVTASTAAGPINPASDTVAMSFLPAGVTPASGDWQTASWDPTGVNSGAYIAQCLVGPGGTIQLLAGTYTVWVKVTDSPEVPVLPAGTIVVS